jgi:hypothetical protein
MCQQNVLKIKLEATHVKSAPVMEGRHKIGTMSATKADAITPIGIENFPRCHGPGRKRLPTKKTRMKMGMVNALCLASAHRRAVKRM